MVSDDSAPLSQGFFVFNCSITRTTCLTPWAWLWAAFHWEGWRTPPSLRGDNQARLDKAVRRLECGAAHPENLLLLRRGEEEDQPGIGKRGVCLRFGRLWPTAIAAPVPWQMLTAIQQWTRTSEGQMPMQLLQVLDSIVPERKTDSYRKMRRTVIASGVPGALPLRV